MRRDPKFLGRDSLGNEVYVGDELFECGDYVVLDNRENREELTEMIAKEDLPFVLEIFQEHWIEREGRTYEADKETII